MAKVISANRLADGAVVFLGPQDQWVEFLPQAETFDTEAALATGLDRAKAAEAHNLVLDIAALEVAGTGPHLAATHLREVIRSAGPTVRRDHGKQAQPAKQL
jgi:hypothetical protein